MRAVVFGPGRLGCGLIGQALWSAGHQVTFVGRDRAMVRHLGRVNRYRVVLSGGDHVEEHEVGDVACLLNTDIERVADAVAEADLVATAVGPLQLPEVAPLLAAGLARRAGRPGSVLAFENELDPGRRLAALVAGSMPDPLPRDVAFASALAHRVVARRVGDPALDRPLTFVGDLPAEVAIDGTSISEPPPVPGLMLTLDYAGCVRRKLFVFGAGHLAAAYVGGLKGYHYIHAAVRDEEVRAVVVAVLREGQAGNCGRLASTPVEAATADAEISAVLGRFENAALDDTVGRVGREPTRKLTRSERIIGPALLAERAGVEPRGLALTAAAALVAAVPSRDRRQMHEVLTEVCGLSPRQGLGRLVTELWGELVGESTEGAVLLGMQHRNSSRVPGTRTVPECEVGALA